MDEQSKAAVYKVWEEAKRIADEAERLARVTRKEERALRRAVDAMEEE